MKYFYNIEPISISLLNNGSSNINFLIGSKQGFFVLKYMPFADSAFCEYQEWLSKYLQDYFPNFIFNKVNKSGKLVTLLENSMWKLRIYKEGRFYDMKNVNDTLLVAEQLSILHGLEIPENIISSKKPLQDAIKKISQKLII
ncbi:hypothetical protein [Listeria seeligeri]|uniref:hypothetical protein n=1 Tax=Listeria seeligeri TaxID=1640 RepID=UPI0022EB20E7|nr:hypothetical protein [Listeria seeligeri]